MKWNACAIVSFFAALETAQGFLTNPPTAVSVYRHTTKESKSWMVSATPDVDEAEIDYFYDDEDDELPMPNTSWKTWQLKAEIQFIGGNCHGCESKEDLVQRLLELRGNPAGGDEETNPAVPGFPQSSSRSLADSINAASQDGNTVQPKNPFKEPPRKKKEQPQAKKQSVAKPPPKKQPAKRSGPWDPSQMSAQQIKKELDTFGVDYSDCLEKLDLLERWEDMKQVQAKKQSVEKPPQKKQPAKRSGPWDPSQMSAQQIKKELDTFGVDYSDCLEKLDLLERWEDVRANPKSFLAPRQRDVVKEEEEVFVPPSQPQDLESQYVNAPPPEPYAAPDKTGFESSSSESTIPSGGTSVYGYDESEIHMSSLWQDTPTQSPSGTDPFQNNQFLSDKACPVKGATPNRDNLFGDSSSASMESKQKQQQQPIAFFHSEGTVTLEELEQQERNRLRQQSQERKREMERRLEHHQQPKTAFFQGIQVEGPAPTPKKKKRLPTPPPDQTNFGSQPQKKPWYKNDQSAEATTFFNGVQVEEAPGGAAEPHGEESAQINAKYKRYRAEEPAIPGHTPDEFRPNMVSDPQRAQTDTFLGIQVESAESNADPYDNAFSKKRHGKFNPSEETEFGDWDQQAPATNNVARGPDDPFNLPTIEQPYPEPKKPASKGGYIQDTHQPPQERKPNKPPPTTSNNNGIGPAQDSYEGLWDDASGGADLNLDGRL